ncbi:MAG: hypothetical protein WC391_08140 [Methanoregula sp.]|jgi:hypothetical protein
MQDETLSEAIIYDKLNLLRKDFFGYIERNTEKIDVNLPVFYGYVISALENSFPKISADSFDAFLDDITFKVLDASPNSADFEYVKKVMQNALRQKKKKDSEMGIHIVVGLKLLKNGDHAHALEYLKNYWHLDTLLGTAVAHCYYMLSLREVNALDEMTKIHRPNELELLAREKLLDLARVKPPVFRLSQVQIEDPTFLHTIFWQMIRLSLQWFPNEKWFIQIGLKNAVITKNTDIRKELIQIGTERFYTDIDFLREMYYFKIENRDAGGAAGVVNQLITQYPNDIEPIFFGLRLSLLTSKKSTYHNFRRLAVTRGMSSDSIALFDFAFALMTSELRDASNLLVEFEKDYPRLQYYATTLRYLARDFSSGDETRVKQAKKILFDSVDQYSLEKLEAKKNCKPC